MIFCRVRSFRNTSKICINTTQSLHCLLRVSPPSEPLKSFSLLQWVLSPSYSYQAVLYSCLILLVNQSDGKYEKMQIQLNWSSKSTFVPHVKWCCWIYQVLHLSLQMVGKMFSFGILWKFFPIAVLSKGCFMRWVFWMAAPPDPYSCADKKTSGEL